MERTILHCDLNNYFASVECILHPEYRKVPIAVCGSAKERHGIVLAKNQLAKKAGVITGEAIWQAKRKCPELIIASPHYKHYEYYSEIVQSIYCRYTDLVEPMGIDECFLDVSGSRLLFGNGESIAHSIRETVKRETGLTISVGVSFNKIFAKLGSDLKKPDAVTCISKDNFKEIAWPLPAIEMLGVGVNTYKILHDRYIKTIGDLAACPPSFLERVFGKYGLVMWTYANGLERSEVARAGSTPPLKSVGHGITTTSDLTQNSEVYDVITELSQQIGWKLRQNGLCARAISVSARDCSLVTNTYQQQLPFATQSTRQIIKAAKEIFTQKHTWHKSLRTITVRTINLIPAGLPQQLDLFTDYEKMEKDAQLDKTIDAIRDKYGCHAVTSASYLNDIKIARHPR